MMRGLSLFPEWGVVKNKWCEINHGHTDVGSDKNQATPGNRGVINIHLSLVVKSALYYNKGDNLLKFLALHTIFLKLAKYSYFHNHLINMFTIFISVSGFPGPIIINMSIEVYKSNINAFKTMIWSL